MDVWNCLDSYGMTVLEQYLIIAMIDIIIIIIIIIYCVYFAFRIK